METKYVIIMHNLEGHNLEESPLLDSYPKPEVIEFYLSQSNYSFAKLNAPRVVHEVYYLSEEGIPELFGTHDKAELSGFILNLADRGLPYQTLTGGN